MNKLKLGDKAPDFTLPGVDGQTHILHNYADKNTLVIIFSCNHCPYVQAWEDRIKDSGAELFEAGFKINSTPSSEEEEECVEFGKSFAKF